MEDEVVAELAWTDMNIVFSLFVDICVKLEKTKQYISRCPVLSFNAFVLLSEVKIYFLCVSQVACARLSLYALFVCEDDEFFWLALLA